MKIESNNKLEFKSKFFIDSDEWGIEPGKLLDREKKTYSTLYRYFRDFLIAPGPFIAQLEGAKWSSLAAIMKRHDEVPDVFNQVGQDFYNCLAKAEEDFEFETVKAMWKSIGIALEFSKPHVETTISDVLAETGDVILAPVIYSLNGSKNLSAFQAKVCLISNAGIDTVRPKTAILIKDNIDWDRVIENCIWTCSNEEGTARKFEFPYRLSIAKMKKHSQTYIQSMAEMLTFEGYCVWTPFRRPPLFALQNKSGWNTRNKGRPQTMPRYEWNQYDPKKRERIDPIEPCIMRDFIQNGDQRVRLEGAMLMNQTAISPWEQDDEYLVPYTSS